jgi:site-specific recombinase XerD
MQRQTFSVLFYIRKKRILRNGKTTIYARITINNKRVELSTNISIEPDNFNSDKGMVMGYKRENLDTRSFLENLKSQLYSIYKSLKESNEDVTAKMVRDVYCGNDQEGKSLLFLFEEHNSSVAKSVSNGTLVKYSTCYRHLFKFIGAKYKLKDIPLRKVDSRFVYLFESYLRNTANCSKNTTLKYLQTLKKITKLALSFGYIIRDPFFDYKFRFENVERYCLTEQELTILENKVFTIERVATVRDIFLFCCFTGLAYSDVKSLESKDINVGVDGKKWITKKRTKTGITSRVPLLPVPLRVLKKYESHSLCRKNGTLLPVISNQKMNVYLKEIADVCGFDKNITTHLARHTFATTVTLQNGVSLETVSKTLGHTNLKTTLIYAKISDSKISKDMESAFEKYENKI